MGTTAGAVVGGTNVGKRLITCEGDVTVFTLQVADQRLGRCSDESSSLFE